MVDSSPWTPARPALIHQYPSEKGRSPCLSADTPADQDPPNISDGAISPRRLSAHLPGQQADAVMRAVSEHFDQRSYAVRLSGWWLIVCTSAGAHWAAEATDLPVYRTNLPNPQR